MSDENKYIGLYVYVGATSRRLVSIEDVPLRVQDHAWRATTETRRQNTAAQAVVRHGRPASGVDELGDELKSGPIRSILDTVGQKYGSYRSGWVLRRNKWPWDLMMGCESEIPETARTFIIRHSLMPMIPSDSNIWQTHLGTIICFVPWSGY